VGEPLALREILAAHPQVLAGLELTACLLPGMNEFDYAALNPQAKLTTFLLPTALRASFAAGRVRVRPEPYSQIAESLAREAPFDLALLQVACPDAAGRCSLGPCSDFAPIVWPRAARRIGFINPRLPATREGPCVPLAAFDVAVQAPGPFVCAPEAAPGPVLAAIAERVGRLVPDGAAIQSGIGGAPAAAIWRLEGRRGLRVRSGMVTPGYRRLAEAGALDPAARHVTGLALGDEDFMRWAAGAFAFEDVYVTHGAQALAATPNLYAINAALEIDLFGQANLEWREGRLYSGLGGAPDFARAARVSGGRAILALPSASRSGASRIVPRLATPTVSLARHETDLVVTEHGVADLRGGDLDGRASALIALAAPGAREALNRAWRRLRADL
jgi:acyl-CoA hydrolase